MTAPFDEMSAVLKIRPLTWLVQVAFNDPLVAESARAKHIDQAVKSAKETWNGNDDLILHVFRIPAVIRAETEAIILNARLNDDIRRNGT